MFTRSKLIVFLILVGVAIGCVLRFVINEDENQIEDAISELVASNEVGNTQVVVYPNVTKADNPYSTNLSDCNRFTKRKRQYDYSWARSEHETWGNYLSRGYSIDDITLAVEYFLNSNFAASFRVKQLRTNSELVTKNRVLNEELKNYFPEVVESKVFHISRKIPASNFKNYGTLSRQEKQLVLTTSPPSIDDVAYFTNQKDVLDVDIMALIDATSNPKGIVGYDRLEAVSLLDYAINANRLPVVEHLLNIGLMPTSDKYLGSSMEWALARLRSRTAPEEIADSVKIIKLLKNKGAKARFKTKTYLKVEGDFPRRYYEFDRAKIEHIMNEYGLDLTSIETESPLYLNEGNELLIALKDERQTYVLEQFELRDINPYLAACDLIQKTIAKKWKPRQPQEIIDKLGESNVYSSAEIESLLSDIDPYLVDFYRIKNDRYVRKQMYVDVPDNVFRPLNAGKLPQVIDYFLSLDLTDANKNWVLIQILLYNISFYDGLVASDLMVDKIEYLNLKNYRLLNLQKIQQLNETSYDLLGQDVRNKTLLYYAVRSGDLQLVMYLQEENAPFVITSFGEDPLHAALNESRYRENFNTNIIPIVDVLMRYSPEIDEFHLQRMAVLALTAPQVYQELVTRHPQLAAKTDLSLPKVR
ncbi:MAG: hypothetical protein ABJH28_01535 [Paraglaciecola sp.]|uniref:hypothetical protein n=1 Tax=Paraglaciecola sp. TaxID=1920173 RepID=UPI003297504A